MCTDSLYELISELTSEIIPSRASSFALRKLYNFFTSERIFILIGHCTINKKKRICFSAEFNELKQYKYNGVPPARIPNTYIVKGKNKDYIGSLKNTGNILADNPKSFDVRGCIQDSCIQLHMIKGKKDVKHIQGDYDVIKKDKPIINFGKMSGKFHCYSYPDNMPNFNINDHPVLIDEPVILIAYNYPKYDSNVKNLVNNGRYREEMKCLLRDFVVRYKDSISDHTLAKKAFCLGKKKI